MSTSVFEHTLTARLFGCPAIASLFAPDAALGHMLRVEAALTEAMAGCGLVDAGEAARVLDVLATFRPDSDALAASARRDGVPVPGLLAQLRAAVDEAAGTSPSGTSPGAPHGALHGAATSQDIMDTALVLTLRAASEHFAGRLERLDEALGGLAARHGERTLTGRTRMQAARPMRVADRLHAWREPLRRHRRRLDALRPDIEVLQLGGAVGDRRFERAPALAAALADALGLACPERAWHTARDGPAHYASWLSVVSGSLGKLGQDVALMAQQGVDEIELADAGRSSAMPHKRNPVTAELLVTLARFNAVQVSGMHHAVVHEQERSGAAWGLEWMILPPMCESTGRALDAAIELVGAIVRIGRD